MRGQAATCPSGPNFTATTAALGLGTHILYASQTTVGNATVLLERFRLELQPCWPRQIAAYLCTVVLAATDSSANEDGPWGGGGGVSTVRAWFFR